MGFHVPFSKRPFRRDQGCHTFSCVTYALVTIAGLAVGFALAAVGYVAWVAVH